MAAGTQDDPSFRHWLEFHEQHERLELGYRYVFEAYELEALVRCHDEHGFAIVKGVLPPADVAAFRDEIAEKGSMGPSIERYASQQKLLQNEKWMAVQRRLLDVAPEDEALGLTAHHSTVLIRADNSRGPAGLVGPLCTPFRTLGALSRPSITH
jgi:hypothetical protein